MLRIGFVFDLPTSDRSSNDVSLEYEDSRTLDWIRSVLKELGEVIDIPWSPEAVGRLAELMPDVVFNITEASGSRNRESLVPAVAESLGIAYTGSDAVSLGVSLDKYLTKIVASSLGIETPEAALLGTQFTERDVLEATKHLRYPLIVKPNTGGSSMGIWADSNVSDPDGLLRTTRKSFGALEEPLLVEEFIAGREITAALLDHECLRILPPAEILFEEDETADIRGRLSRFYSVEKKSLHEKEVRCPADLPRDTAERVNTAAVAIFKALGCSGFARIDYRIDGDGTPFFIEINPLPGLSPYYSIFPMQARAGGIGAEELIAALVGDAVTRGREKERA